VPGDENTKIHKKFNRIIKMQKALIFAALLLAVCFAADNTC